MFNLLSQTSSGITDILLNQGVLGLCVLALGIAIVYQQKKLDSKDEKIDELNRILLEEIKNHTIDYRDMAKNDQAALLASAQSGELLAAKIEVGKQGR